MNISLRIARFASLAFAMALGLLPGSSLSAQDVLITEFLAVNNDGVTDEDGDRPDWVEFQNVSADPVNLGGWYLTDDELDLQKWQFPSVELGPGDFLLVFASSKNRAIAGSELHANFSLGSVGEYLALVRSNGSIEHEFAPTFPEQFENVSYGITQDVSRTSLVVEGQVATYSVPANGADGLDWTLPGFADGAWPRGPTGIGHDSGVQIIPDPDGPVNLAPDGVATQSSQLGGFAPGLAIDGDYGNFTHTQSGQNLPATWELDLGEARSIQLIVLHNRSSCCGSRLRDITVSILDGGDVVFESDLLNAENVLGGGGTDGPTELTIDLVTEAGGPVFGDTVRVVRTPDPDNSGTGGAGNSDESNVLSLAEVEVFEGSSGYASHIATDIENDMLDIRASAYARIEFDVADLGAFDVLTLRMKYDDGFIAYLNGREVARRNAPAQPSWNSSATSENPDTAAILFENFNLSEDIDALQETGNVLAIHGLNLSAADDDFLIVPELAGVSFVQDVPRYFQNPTPGAPNDADGVVGFVGDTTFSVDRGFFSEAFSVDITSATEGATIRYTLDGSSPTTSRGTVFSSSIPIDRTTILRAIAYLDGFEPTNVDTHTYLFLEDVIASSVMRTSITRHQVYGPQMEASLTDLPTISLVTSGSVNNSNEIKTSVEWIDPDGGREFQEDAGIKYFGGNVTNFPKKNYRIFFRNRFGASKLKFPLFAGHDRTIPAAKKFDQFELRTGSHDMNQRGFYMSNRFTDDTMLDMGNLNPHGRFVHVYLDGTYWGQYHLRERWHDSMHANYLGGRSEDYESINGNRNIGGAFGAGFPYDGDGSTWTRAKSLRGNYDAVKDWVDLPHYLDFMLLFNFGNSETEYRAVGPTTAGSGFKFYLNDADGFTRGVGNRLSVAGPGEFWSALRSQRHPDFMTLLGDRIHKHYFGDGAMTPAKMTTRLLERCRQVERAFYSEAARWNFRTPSSWESAKNSYVNGVLPTRSATVLGYFRAAGLYPNTVAPEFNRNGGEVPAGFGVSLTAPVGEIYATIDGSDPRLPGGAISPTAFTIGIVEGTTVLGAGAAVRAHVPQDDSLGLAWTELNFDDTNWRAGTTGVGFETGSGYQNLIETDMEDLMHGVNSSAYMRIPFDFEDPGAVTFLVLRMKYDDGYIAYVNGVEVASRNAPADATWNSRSDGSHSDSLAIVFENVDIGIGLDALVPGRNILAIHGFNTTAGGGDFLMLPEISAAEASGGLRVFESSVVKARARNGASWSALSEASFVVDLPLRVTELMYHPPAPLVPGLFSGDEFEYIELKNIGDEVIDLAGVRLAGGISFDFGTGAVDQLPPGEVMLVVRNLAAFESRYGGAGFLIAGEYQGNLSNGSDRVEIRGKVGEEVLGFDYLDTWHPTTDGGGFSLVHIDPELNLDSWNDPSNWQPSGSILGTPGIDDSGDPADGGWQRIGDANQDGGVDLSDGISLLRHLFLGDPIALPCDGETLDDGGNRILLSPNGDAQVDISDAIYLLEYLFLGGAPPTLGAGCVRIPGCASACIF